jgi:pyruvate dehydrogenase E2 component (dihydrolipoamide acetyltransferase)
MAHAVRMPKPGQMTEECMLALWLKAEGDVVAKGDVLFEIETDKSNMDVESFHDGVLLRQVVAAGETVPVNAICAWIGALGEAVPAGDEPPAAELQAIDSAAPAVPMTRMGTTAAEAVPPIARHPPSPRIAISPRANRLALEADLNPRSVVGTGPEQRITERDVTAAIAARGSRAIPEGVDAAGPTDDEAAPRPLSRMRQVIAQRLTLSATTIPTFSVTTSVDVTRLMDRRDALRDLGTHVTVTDFVMVAAARTLAEFPDVNARTDGVSVWPRRRVHLGLAVSLPAGLVVAVVRDADRLDLEALHDRAAALVAAARAGTLPLDDMTGSTFTVSNLGMFGVDAFTAIINPWESGILAVGGAIPAAVVVGDGIAVRSIMKLTLTADHRLVDGELGARFLNAVRGRLEDPISLDREPVGN